MEVIPSIEELRHWADRLEEVQERLAPYFERAEPRQRAMAYIRGEVAHHRAQERVAVSRIGGRSDARRDATSAQHGAVGCGPGARRPARVRPDAYGRPGNDAGGR